MSEKTKRVSMRNALRKASAGCQSALHVDPPTITSLRYRVDGCGRNLCESIRPGGDWLGYVSYCSEPQNPGLMVGED